MIGFSVGMSDGGIYGGVLRKIDQNQYYRVPHDKERYSDGRYGGDGFWGGKVRDRADKPIPEVYRLYPDQTTPIDCKWLKLWWAINPLLDREHFQLMLDDHWMLCNGTGFPSRYNCLTGKPGDDPDDKNKNPAFHGALICGGAAVKGKVLGNNLYLDTLIISDPLPTKEYLLENKHLWYYATSVASSGNVTYSTFTGIDGNRQRLRIPILTTERVYIPLRELDKLPLGFFPPESTWKP